MDQVRVIWKPERSEITLSGLSWIEKKKRKEKKKKNQRDPGRPVIGGLTLRCSDTILAKGSNPEMKLTRMGEFTN